MNFTDVYKSANNKIEGNRDLLDKTFATQRGEKHYRLVGFCTVCAAAITILVCSLSFDINFSNTKNTPQVLHVAPSNDSNSSKIDETNAMQNKRDLDSKAKKENPSSENLRSFQAVTEYETPENFLPDENPMAASNEITTSEICMRELSKREYIEYLDAWGIISNLTLPEGFVINEPDNYIITTDASGKNTIDDSVNIDARYMDRVPIKIIVGKQTPPQKTEGITKRYGNTEVNILQTDNEIFVFLIYDNIWVDATFSNITYGDLNMLLSKFFEHKNLN